MDHGGRVAVCPWFVYVWERWAGAFLSPSPSSLFHPGYQRSSNTPLHIWQLLLPLAYIQTVCGLMHIAAAVGCPLVPVWMFALGPSFKPVLYSLCSSNGVGNMLRLWDITGWTGYICSQSDQICFVGNCFALLCVGTGGLASAVATRGVDFELHSDTSCYVTGIRRSPAPTPKIHLLSAMSAKQISWSLCMAC